MTHERWVMGAAGLLFGLMIGFMLGVWKAAKMQALREAQQAHLASVEEVIRRGTSISHIEPTRPWPKK